MRADVPGSNPTTKGSSMRLVFLVLLFTAACAGPSIEMRERTLNRGTYVSPPTATTGAAPGAITTYGPGPGIPGAGMAVVGPPSRQQTVPRSSGRVLPSTPEPGVWARDNPDDGGGGGGDPGDERGVLLGFELPLLAPELSIDDAATLAYQCAALMNSAWDSLSMDQEHQDALLEFQLGGLEVLPVAGTKAAEKFWEEDRKRRKCAASVLFNLCASHASKHPVHVLTSEDVADLRSLPEGKLGRILMKLAKLVEDSCPSSARGKPGWRALYQLVTRIEQQYPMRAE